jgi:hypothetical protein
MNSSLTGPPSTRRERGFTSCWKRIGVAPAIPLVTVLILCIVVHVVLLERFSTWNVRDDERWILQLRTKLGLQAKDGSFSAETKVLEDHVVEQRADGEAKDPTTRLNILLLYADDWTMKTLGALNDRVKTPNLDQLARNGMLFTNNCVTTSVCWISRATLLTGQYASVHGQNRYVSFVSSTQANTRNISTL